MLNQWLLYILGILALSELGHAAEGPRIFRNPTPAASVAKDNGQNPDEIRRKESEACLNEIRNTLNSQVSQLKSSGTRTGNAAKVEEVTFVIENEEQYIRNLAQETLVCEKDPETGKFTLHDRLQERKDKLLRESSLWKRTYDYFVKEPKRSYADNRASSGANCKTETSGYTQYDMQTPYCECAKKAKIEMKVAKASSSRLKVDIRIKLKDGEIYQRPWFSIESGKFCTASRIKKSTDSVPAILASSVDLDFEKGPYLQRTIAAESAPAGKSICTESGPLVDATVVNVKYSCSRPSEGASADEAPQTSE